MADTHSNYRDPLYAPLTPHERERLGPALAYIAMARRVRELEAEVKAARARVT